MSANTQLPPIGSEWFEDDSRFKLKHKITVVAHWNDTHVVITRNPESQKYRTRARGDRFGKKRGYLPWSQRRSQ